MSHEFVTPCQRKTYEYHRVRVKSAKSVVDVVPPKNRPHIKYDAKKKQLESERQEKILRENFILLKKLEAIMYKRKKNGYKPKKERKANMDEELDFEEIEAAGTPDSNNEFDFELDEVEEKEKNVFEKDSLEEESYVYLSSEEAARCLCILGKNDSGLKYSYLMIKALDKNLTDISVIPTFRNILFVDVSGNRLTQSSIKVLQIMTYLLMIKADRNIIESVEMEPMLYLQVLSLNNNKISNTTGISHRLLECLELNNNKITSVNLNPYILENLKVLELRGNLLRTTNGIFFPTLVSLYISDNKIDKIEGLDTLINLKILHLRNNRISMLDGLDIPKCSKLNYVNLRNNKIAKFSELKKLRNLPGLETLVISENPLTLIPDENNMEINEEDDNDFRIRLIALIPNLKRINKDPILEDERQLAKELREEMFQDETSFDERGE